MEGLRFESASSLLGTHIDGESTILVAASRMLIIYAGSTTISIVQPANHQVIFDNGYLLNFKAKIEKVSECVFV
jgi:hypothetical protein